MMFPLTLGYIGTTEILMMFWASGIVKGIFWIFQIVDVARRQFAEPNLKIIWVLIMVFTGFIGALVYFFLGKPQGQIPAGR